MYILLHDPSVCVFMYGQATESRWVYTDTILFINFKIGKIKLHFLEVITLTYQGNMELLFVTEQSL